MSIDKKSEVLIEKWEIKLFLKGEKRLFGCVYGHAEFPTGYHVITSAIVDTDFKTYAETRNTMYTLGEQHV